MKNPPEDAEISPEQCFQLHIFTRAKQAYNEMASLIETKTIEERLDEMLVKLRQFKGQQKSEEIITMLTRYKKDEFADLFD